MGTVGVSLLIGIAIASTIFCAAVVAGLGLATGFATWKWASAAVGEHLAERAMKKNTHAIVEGAKDLCRQNAKGK